MSETLAVQKKELSVAQVMVHGEQLVVPTGMTLPKAVDLLQRRMKYLEEVMSMQETFDVFPWDGAHALDAVLTEKFGWTPAEATKSIFGDIPPKLISIDIGPDQVVSVPWGAFSLPTSDGGMLQTGSTEKNGRVGFAIAGKLKRKDEEIAKDIFARLRERLKTHSIYRGKAIKMRFCADDGSTLEMPVPKFIDTREVNDELLVYPDAVSAAIETSLFTPIRRVADLKLNKIPIKRGVLLGGIFGTGKTLAAMVAAKYAVEAGVTYLYVQRADELGRAIDFARQYMEPACVIFCEDIDRAMSGDRTVAIDDILNIIDGIDTKNSPIIIVLTTNNLQSINQAMLRPGRLDAVIEITTPDAPAVEKLLRIYGGSAIEADCDLKPASAVLAGNIPAVIAEAVKRAKLAQLRRTPPGKKVTKVTGEALLEAAETMRMQLDLLNRKPEKPDQSVDSAIRRAISDELNDHPQIVRTHNLVDQIHDHVC